MMRGYTTIEQSKVLAEILPIESADMYYWCGISIRIGSYMAMDKDLDIPAWSLAALLGTMPSVIKRKGKRMFLTLEKAGAYNLYYKSPDRLDELWETKEEPVDSCVKMILKLKEENLI